MDGGWTQDLLNWLTANPGWAGFWVFVMSLVESLAFVGILVPGIIILFGIGATGAPILPNLQCRG